MQDMNWDDLRFVLAVFRGQSYADAARALKVNESTVSRRIHHMERGLNQLLFERSGRTLTATETGLKIVRQAELAETPIMELSDELGRETHHLTGTVRITAVSLLVNYLLLPGISAFTDKNPGIRLELISDPRDLSLARRETDIALRLARPTADQGAIARRIATFSYAVYGATRHTGKDLPWITYNDRMSDLPQARWIDKMVSEGEEVSSVRVNDAEALLQAIHYGQGRSLLPTVIGESIPSLSSIKGYSGLPERELWMIIHPDLYPLKRIKCVRKWLIQLLEPPAGPDPKADR